MNKNGFVNSLRTGSTCSKRAFSFSFFLPLFLGGVGCSEAPLDSIASQEQQLGGVTVIANFDATLGQLPESVTTDCRGNFYFSMANTVQKLAPNGTLSLYAQLPISADAKSAGVKFAPNGDLYVVSAAFDPTLDAARVFRVGRSGQVTQVAQLDPTGFPNDLAFDDRGNAFVTDPFLGQIYKIEPSGRSSVWVKNPLLNGDPANPALIFHAFGVDGIAFDGDQRNLYVGNLDRGAIVRIPVGAGQQPGTPQDYVVDAKLRGADGIAFNIRGDLYVAVNGQDQLALVSANRTVSVIAAGSPLDAPSSLVFAPSGDDCSRGNYGADRKTLYFSNFAINRAFGTQTGTPHPSFAKLAVPHAGLPLP